MKTIKRLFAAVTALAVLVPATAMAAIADSFPIKKGDSGNSVYLIQQRLLDLGYLNFTPTASYGEMTYRAVLNFQERNSVTKDGMLGEDTFSSLYASGIVRAAANPAIARVAGAGLMALPTEYGEASAWGEIDRLFPVGQKVTVTDFNTLRTFSVTRTGGANHADVQTSDSESYKSFLTCFGGGYTWERRPMMVSINGTKYAASMNGMPNGSDVLKNGTMEGSICLYFSGSTSDIGAVPDAEHNANIKKAANQ